MLRYKNKDQIIKNTNSQIKTFLKLYNNNNNNILDIVTVVIHTHMLNDTIVK